MKSNSQNSGHCGHTMFFSLIPSEQFFDQLSPALTARMWNVKRLSGKSVEKATFEEKNFKFNLFLKPPLTTHSPTEKKEEGCSAWLP